MQVVDLTVYAAGQDKDYFRRKVRICVRVVLVEYI